MNNRITVKRTSSCVIYLSLVLIGCEDSQPIVDIGTTGNVNFSSYVAIGNSFTAGIQSNALFSSGQKYSYPILIAEQARRAGASLSFTQPLLVDPGIGGRMRISKLLPLTIVSDPFGDPTSPAIYVDPTLPANGYNNLGIPYARVYNALTGQNDVLDTLNSSTKSFSPSYGQIPFFHIVLRNTNGSQPGNTGSVFQQAKKLNPTIMTVWFGNNDILGYSTSGGIMPYTPTPSFMAAYGAMIDSLRSTGAKLVLGTIPNVTAIPLFTTLKWFIPDPDDPSKPFANTFIPLYAEKSDGTNGYLSAKDLVLLTGADSLLSGYGLPLFTGLPNAGQPLGNQFVLDSAEIAISQSVTEAYNNVIRSKEDAGNIAVVDFYSIFNDIAQNGKVVSGQIFTTAYVSGGIFTLDGVHPTSQAQGFIANEFVRAINSKWGASIPFVDILNLPGLPVPLTKLSRPITLADIPSTQIRAAMKVWQ
ncbi:MAG: hypothetical protein HYY49_14310 [Ignavibacteriales bacterium]|nr:hypothetical protein [Ignavibacteriales bacterium]